MDCRHFGNLRNCKVITEADLVRKKDDLSVGEAFVVDEEGKVLQLVEGKQFIPHKKMSQQINCPFKVYCHTIVDGVDGSLVWVVSYVKRERNHPITRNVFSYPMNRRLEPETRKEIIGLIQSDAKNSVISSFMNDKGLGTTPKDVGSIRQTVFTNDFDNVMQLQDDSYIVHFNAMRSVNSERRFLQSVFFVHKSVVGLACRFNEVFVLDVTYKTN